MKEVIFIRIPLTPIKRLLEDAFVLAFVLGTGIVVKHWWWSDLSLEAWFIGGLIFRLVLAESRRGE